jgi:HPt (histidine-containing phosphotransfer) domain-containing protein
VGGNLELLQELFTVFKTDSARLIDEIRQALEQKDAAKLRMSAHTLKGMPGFFEVPQAVEKAGRLESLGKELVLTGAHELFGELVQEIRFLESTLSEWSP